MPKFIDLTGQKFGRLTVVKRVHNSKWNEVQWLCNCICSNKPIVKSGALKRKNKVYQNIYVLLRNLSGEKRQFLRNFDGILKKTNLKNFFSISCS